MDGIYLADGTEATGYLSVYTGSTSSGTSDVSNCVDWTDNTMGNVSPIGSTGGDAMWLNTGSTAACDEDYPYICIGGQHDHLWFIVDVPNGNLGGLVGADSICQTAATNASLNGTFKAILSDSVDDARSRINVDGPVYDVNGTLVISALSNIWSITELGHDDGIRADGTVTGFQIFTGTISDGTANANHCSDWISTSEIAAVGNLNEGYLMWNSTESCGVARAIACISQ